LYSVSYVFIFTSEVRIFGNYLNDPLSNTSLPPHP
jgi:hypothetical protein